ncbi:MAG: MarR family transcriptional regulator [Spirochaetes bacterium]|uniref:MarR family transcriptional regulator n=1 Tax=Candidatus Gallitreponema excrementavium TaxID=2840840 RepID=A0A9D9HQT2_9SPIR|nr:MarR family transcriptional regulator [Candidatus Gallitreponema excrementavium]
MSFINDSPFKSISILYRKSHIWLNKECESYGLTAPQALVILIVCDYKVLSQEEITRRLSLDKSVIAKTVNKLVQNGFLVRSINKTDKRFYDISPAKKATELYTHIRDKIEKCFEKMTREMTENEKMDFKRLLLTAAESSISQDE